MKPRNTLILLILVALTAATLWHFELREGGAGDDDERTRLFPGIDANQVEWTQLVQADGSAVRLERRGDAWRITQPIDFAADRFAADGVASALSDLATATVFDPAAEDASQHPEPLESYGLTREPRVRFSAAGKTYALRLGDPTPVAGNVYVAVEGDARVFVVPQWQTSALTKSLRDLREARLLDFERDKLQKIALVWSGGAATLEKQAEGWRLTAPLDDAADEVAVQALISDLQGARAVEFLAPPPSDHELGFDPPSYRAELSLEGGASYALTIGAKRGDEHVAARSGASGAVEIAGSILERLPKDASALRDKTLASFVSSDAQRFTLMFRDPAGDELAVTGTRSAEGWDVEPAMEPGAASALVAEIASLSGSSIAAESLGEAELAAFGLAPPRAHLRVVGAAEADEPPVLADVRLGVLRAGAGLAAMRAGRDVVYWIAESRADALPQSAAHFRESFAEKPRPTSDGAPPPAEDAGSE